MCLTLHFGEDPCCHAAYACVQITGDRKENLDKTEGKTCWVSKYQRCARALWYTDPILEGIRQTLNGGSMMHPILLAACMHVVSPECYTDKPRQFDAVNGIDGGEMALHSQ